MGRGLVERQAGDRDGIRIDFMPTALICGITGQDGAYLSRFLLGKGYRVVGTSRDAQIAGRCNLLRLRIDSDIELVSMNLTDFGSVIKTLSRAAPDEVYNLAGQTSVGLSFDQPREAMDSIAIGSLNLLEALRFLRSGARLYNACSSECFGETGNAAADETTAFRPRSPYATSKAAAFWQVANYREAYGMFACSGILFNHESPLRPTRFVTRKVAAAVARILGGRREKLLLGDVDICRDWGWAEEYVEAMWLMLQHDRADDFVIATGETHSLREFVVACFTPFGLDWNEFVEIDPSLLRPADIRCSRGDPRRARGTLDWQARTRMLEVAHRLVEGELRSASPASSV
jgi:GDPmannose 4,6-dehydratase